MSQAALRRMYGGDPRLPFWLDWSSYLPTASWFPLPLSMRSQHWSGKSIHKVSLLGPGDGERKSLSILAKSWQIQKNQLCGISSLVLSIQELSREKNFKKSVDFLVTENVCCKYFSNQMNQDVLVAWLLSDVGGLENSRTHFSLSLKTNTIKLIHSLFYE